MNIVVINPFNRTVTDHDVPFNNLDDIVNVLKPPFSVPSFIFTAFNMPLQHVCFIDDEGLLHDTAEQRFWTASFYHSRLAGIGAICRVSHTGDNVGTKIRAAHIRTLIDWLPEGVQPTGFETKVDENVDTLLGKTTVITTTTQWSDKP